MAYKYTVDIDHYTNGSGYSYTETIDTGNCDTIITAEDWYNGFTDKNDEPFDLENEYITVKVRLYNDDDDPMFDDPISTSEYDRP